MYLNKRPFEDEARLESQSSKKIKSAPMLEEIINSPGLQHIAEEIFLNLDFNGIMTCKLVNISCKDIVDKPMFWLKKWKLRGLSNENYKDWINAIKITKNTTLEKNVDAYIKKVIKVGHFVDAPCYIDSKIVSEFSNEFSFLQTSFNEKNAGILQLAAVENIKQINFEIHFAAQNGHLECIKVLAPLCENPNTPLLKAIFLEGKTPIQAAEKNGHDEIKKFLQSFL